MKYFKISRYSICWKKKFQKHHFLPKFEINEFFKFELPPNCTIVTPFITALFFHFQNVEICSTDPLVVARPPTIKTGIKKTLSKIWNFWEEFFSSYYVLQRAWYWICLHLCQKYYPLIDVSYCIRNFFSLNIK